MNLLNKINKTAQRIAVETTTNVMSQNKSKEDKNMDYINKYLEKFIAFQKMSTTNRPTTTEIDYDDFAQKLEELLKKKRTQSQKTPITEKRDSMKFVMDNLDAATLKSFGTAVKQAVQKENRQSEDQNLLSQIKMLFSVKADSSKITTTTERTKTIETTTRNQNNLISADIIKKISDSVKANVLHDLQASMRITAAPKIRIKNTDNETQPLAADIIKEISDSIKASVLKDIQDAISTSLKPVSVTTKKPKTVNLTRKRKLIITKVTTTGNYKF